MSTATPSRTPVAASPSTPALAPAGQALAATVSGLERRHGVRIGVALTPVGGHDEVWQTGSLRVGPAWSTAKVPLAIAALRRHPGPPAPALARAAITRSDNAAADRLHRLLGTPAQASAATQQVLRRGGDRTTVVPARRLREGFSVIGQTSWPLADQARSFATLPCHRDAAPVLTLMGEVVPEQRWGLGTLPGAGFKGGWGPATDGTHLVRQAGLVTLPAHRVDGREVPARRVAVTMAVDRTSMAEGTGLATRLAAAVAAQAPEVAAGGC